MTGIIIKKPQQESIALNQQCLGIMTPYKYVPIDFYLTNQSCYED